MAKKFLTEDFLLHSETARILYHEYAAKMPIFDYHCHLPPRQIAEDKRFENLTQAWLYGDHYKWRAMRTNGVSEKYCTGDADDREKFRKWAQTVPFCLKNPLYHWTHLELKRYFGVEKLLNADTAGEIYNHCNDMLNAPDFSVRNLLRKMNVRVVCTTEDPLDGLEYHQKIKGDGFEIAVHTCWRPDRAMAVEDVNGLNRWIDKLAELTNIEIKSFKAYLEAIAKRHEFFHNMGCRLSDQGVETAYAQDYTSSQIEDIFRKIRAGESPDSAQRLRFKSALMYELALMDYQKGWVRQLHIGALRNNNTRMLRTLGPDTGFDSILDIEIAGPLAKFLDKLDTDDKLPKTILYNLNPADNELVATMIGNFQDGSVPGKLQFGPAWWFLDNKDGIESQLRALSSMGMLSRFVGMVTDSRSFLSYPRHEYFRRILCNLIGEDVENGELPNDTKWLGPIVQDICYNNARNYFPMQVNE